MCARGPLKPPNGSRVYAAPSVEDAVSLCEDFLQILYLCEKTTIWEELKAFQYIFLSIRFQSQHHPLLFKTPDPSAMRYFLKLRSNRLIIGIFWPMAVYSGY